MYCPDWIFEIISAEVASLYLKNDVPLEMGASKYVSGLSENFEELSSQEISSLAEESIRLLGDLEAGELAVPLLQGFAYFRMHYAFQGVKRKLKPMFGDVTSGTKEKEYAAHASFKRFKAYIFAYRSDKALLAPDGWSLSTQTDIKILAEIASQNESPLDFL